MSAIILAIYLSFILLVAFGGGLLSMPLVQGGVTTIGIAVGVGVILIGMRR